MQCDQLDSSVHSASGARVCARRRDALDGKEPILLGTIVEHAMPCHAMPVIEVLLERS